MLPLLIFFTNHNNTTSQLSNMPNNMTSDQTAASKISLLNNISFAQCKYCNKLIAIEVLSEFLDKFCRSSVEQQQDELIDTKLTSEQSFKHYISDEFKLIFFGGLPKNKSKQSNKSLYIRLLKMYLEKTKYKYLYEYGEQHLKMYKESLLLTKYF